MALRSRHNRSGLVDWVESQSITIYKKQFHKLMQGMQELNGLHFFQLGLPYSSSGLTHQPIEGQLGTQGISTHVAYSVDTMSSSELVKLKLSLNFVHGLEIAQLAEHPSGKNSLLLLRNMILMQLLQNLRDLQYLTGHSAVDVPRIPLIEYVGTLYESRELFEERDHAFREEIYRQSMLKQLANWIDTRNRSFPRFLNSSTQIRLLETLQEKGIAQESLRVEFDRFFQELESSKNRMILADYLIKTAPWSYSTMADSEKREAFKQILSQTGFLLSFYALHQMGISLSSESIALVEQTLRELQPNYEQEISSTEIELWMTDTELEFRKSLFEGLRANLNQSLHQGLTVLETSSDEKTLFQSVIFAQPMVLSLALQALTEDIHNLELKGRTQKSLETLWQKRNYSEARDFYWQTLRLWMGRLYASDDLATTNLNDLKKSLKNLSPRNISGLSLDVQTEIQRQALADIKAWIELGQLLQFDKDFANPLRPPSASEILSDKKLRDYFFLWKKQMESIYPLLSIKLKRATGDETLEHALRHIQSVNSFDSRAQTLETERLISETLSVVEQDIRQSIEDVVKATSPRELVPFLKGSILSQTINFSFPEFMPYTREILTLIDSPSIVDGVFERAVRPFMGTVGYSFIGILLLKGARLPIPRGTTVDVFLQRLLKDLGPMLYGYGWWFNAAWMSEITYDGFHLWNEKQSLKRIDQGLATSITNTSLVKPLEASFAEIGYKARRLKWIVEIVALVGLNGYSIRAGRETTNYQRDFEEFLYDLDAFRTLRTPAGTWNPDVLREAFESSKKTPGALEAYQRLTIKIESNQTWDLGLIFNSNTGGSSFEVNVRRILDLDDPQLMAALNEIYPVGQRP